MHTLLTKLTTVHGISALLLAVIFTIHTGCKSGAQEAPQGTSEHTAEISVAHAPAVLHLERWTDVSAPADDSARLMGELEKRLLSSEALRNFNARIEMRQSAVIVDALFGKDEDRREFQKILKDVGIESYEMNSAILSPSLSFSSNTSRSGEIPVKESEIKEALDN